MTTLQNASTPQFGGTTAIDNKQLQNSGLRDAYYQIFNASDPNVRFKTTKADANGLLKVESWQVDDYGNKLPEENQPEYSTLEPIRLIKL